MSKVQAQAPASSTAGESSPPARKSRLMLYGVMGLVLVGVLGAGGWFLMPRFLGSAHSETKAEAQAEVAVKATVPLGAVVVNLAGSEARRYVKVAVELGISDAKGTKEIEEWKPQLLDLLITVLSSKSIETLASGDGRVELKQELLTKVRGELGLKKVGRIYFTEFVIQ